MGFMTTVLILNDGLDQIEKHPDEFVTGIKRQMLHGGNVGIGNHANPVTVMRSTHADTYRLYGTWRNTIVDFDPYSAENERLIEEFPDVMADFISHARNLLDGLEAKLLLKRGGLDG